MKHMPDNSGLEPPASSAYERYDLAFDFGEALDALVAFAVPQIEVPPLQAALTLELPAIARRAKLLFGTHVHVNLHAEDTPGTTKRPLFSMMFSMIKRRRIVPVGMFGQSLQTFSRVAV